MVESFICGDCIGSVAGAGCTGVDVGVIANLQLVDGFCYLGDMLGVDCGWVMNRQIN